MRTHSYLPVLWKKDKELVTFPLAFKQELFFSTSLSLSLQPQSPCLRFPATSQSIGPGSQPSVHANYQLPNSLHPGLAFWALSLPPSQLVSTLLVPCQLVSGLQAPCQLQFASQLATSLLAHCQLQSQCRLATGLLASCQLQFLTHLLPLPTNPMSPLSQEPG